MKKLHLITFVLLGFIGFAQESFELQKNYDKTPTIDLIKKSKDQKILPEPKVIYLLQGKEVSWAEIRSLKPETIKFVSVIRDKKEISKYTSLNCNGLIVIQLKKPNQRRLQI